jgi:hypothetical protein
MSEGAIVAEILEHTVAENRDNVSRTCAYADYYSRNPDIGWALLASLVSRNAGYLMTDLRREPVTAILPPAAAERFFLALEACNSAIFLDAFPQLLLYEYAKRAGAPLFHLLDRVSGSRSMGPYWNDHWRGGSPARLDLALVVNEQCHLERRVFGDPRLGACFRTALFALAMRLRMFWLVFPGRCASGDETPLYTMRVGRFAWVDGRIRMGRRLYGLLFASAAGAAVRRWAQRAPEHSGSRADYAPETFAAEATFNTGTPLAPSPTLRRCWPPVRLFAPDLSPWRWPSGSGRFVAPAASEAWPDRRVQHSRIVRDMAALGRILRARHRRRAAKPVELRRNANPT